MKCDITYLSSESKHLFEGGVWMTAVVVTKTDIEKTKIVLCETKEEATGKMEMVYLTEIKNYNNIDYYNTFCDKELMYAQVCHGFETTEIRITDNIIGGQ